MKKLFSAIRLILVAAVITAGVMFGINAMRIRESQAIVERAVKEEVTYFSQGFLFENGFFSLRNNFDKFQNEDGVEYWIDTKIKEFVYLYNAGIVENAKAIDEADAKQIAYDEARKWDEAFFASDVMIERLSDAEYEFFIFELDDKGHKTGEFIRVEVVGDVIKSLEMHTTQNPTMSYLGSTIGESEAIDIAYSVMAGTQTVLEKEDNHLINATFNYMPKKSLDSDPHAPKANDYYWEITIYEIDGQTILAQNEIIDNSAKFICTVDALTSEVTSHNWEVAETDYCPLTGEILTSDEDE